MWQFLTHPFLLLSTFFLYRRSFWAFFFSRFCFIGYESERSKNLQSAEVNPCLHKWPPLFTDDSVQVRYEWMLTLRFGDEKLAKLDLCLSMELSAFCLIIQQSLLESNNVSCFTSKHLSCNERKHPQSVHAHHYLPRTPFSAWEVAWEEKMKQWATDTLCDHRF